MTAHLTLRRFAIVTLLLAAVVAPQAWGQTVEDAKTAYERGDYAGALAIVRDLARKGDPDAQVALGDAHRDGFKTLVSQNHTEAVRWYLLAAGQGNAEAQSALGDMYHSGRGVPRNYDEAATWYRRAAEQGVATAQNNLAVMYDKGDGVPQDYAKALKWYRRAAEQGSAAAQFRLGGMYNLGHGVAQNHTEAAKWYRRVAEQGGIRAQFNLGGMYYEGEGVPQDFAEAARWYRYAANQGPPGAQNNLGVMYEEGHGVSRNLERAHMWFNLAASQTPAAEREDRERSVRNRDRVAALLTPLQLARAQRMAREQQSIIDNPRLGEVLDYDPFPEEPAAATAPVPAPASKPPALETISTGSGFRVSSEGHILTNAHVVKGCVEVRVPSVGPVAVAAQDDAADLALLTGPPGKPFAAFRQGRGVRPGAGVVAVGYPLRGMLASGANVTTGNVAALAGPGDDRRLIQITAPVQPGSSGGPVLDMAGNAVGVVVSKLDAVKMARATGDIPQNVNFAVSAGAARAFLDSESVAYATAPSKDMRAPEEVAAAAKAFTVLIECRGEG